MSTNNTAAPIDPTRKFYLNAETKRYIRTRCPKAYTDAELLLIADKCLEVGEPDAAASVRKDLHAREILRNDERKAEDKIAIVKNLTIDGTGRMHVVCVGRNGLRNTYKQSKTSNKAISPADIIEMCEATIAYFRANPEMPKAHVIREADTTASADILDPKVKAPAPRATKPATTTDAGKNGAGTLAGTTA